MAGPRGSLPATVAYASVCLSVPVSPLLPVPCELAFPLSGAFSAPRLWVQPSPSTALDAGADPLNLYCLRRGSAGHTWRYPGAPGSRSVPLSSH